MSKKRALIVSLVLGLQGFGGGTVFGWGENGHRITAEIAERNLNEKAKAVVKSILGDELMIEISIWPDEIRSDDTWDFVQPWHFISIDDDESFDGLKRSLMGDVMMKLDEFEKFLRDPKATAMEMHGKRIGKREALAFYVHFVGDIHQPLHVGRRDDHGGNKILVEWFGDEVNLHSVWDEHLIASTHLSYSEFVTLLDRVPEEEVKAWQAASYLDWAKEAKEVRPVIYDFGKQREDYYLNRRLPPKLSYEYRSRALPILRDRLAKAGIRLAGKLNEIFAAY